MQTTRYPDAGEDFIFILICCCLISILTWNILLTSSDFSRSLLNHGTMGSKSEEFEAIHPERRNLLRDLRPRGNQFLARTAVENERNYIDFVLSSNKQWQSTVDNTGVVSAKMKKDVSTVNTKAVSEFPPRMQENIIPEHENKSSTKTSINTNSDNTINTIHNLGASQKHLKFDATEQKDSNHDIKQKANSNTEQIKSSNATAETINHEKQIHQKVNVRNESACQENSMSSSNDADRTKSKLINDEVSPGTWSKTNGEHEEYSNNRVDCKNQVINCDGGVDCARHKFETHLEIGRSDVNENFLEGYSGGRGIRIEEYSAMESTCFLARNVLTSLIEKIDNFSTESNESSNKKIITLKSSGPREHLFENEFTEEAREENYEATSFCDEHQRPNMAVDSTRERLSPIQPDGEICPRNEGDYLGEQFGVFPEKEANRIEEKSIMHSYKNSTQSRGPAKEGGKKFGSLPVTDFLKNDCKADFTISSAIPAAVNNGKEEEDLNSIIRRMIIAELRKHQQKKQATVKRAHSDTDSTITKKKNSVMKRTGLFNSKGQTFFQDLIELEKDLQQNFEKKWNGESTEARYDKNNRKQEFSNDQDTIRMKNETEVDTVVKDDANDNSVDSSEHTLTVHSNIMLERKINFPCLPIDPGRKQISKAERFLINSKYDHTCKSTQTEQVYVIRSARSCPLRRRRFSLHLQLERLATRREAVCSMTVYASRDFTKYIFRKASDNLIYEKGKGSRSPSYIAAPQRFRWRYVTPKSIT